MELFIKAKKMLNSIDVRGKYAKELVPMYQQGKAEGMGISVKTELDKAAAVLAVSDGDSNAPDVVRALVYRAREWGNTKLVNA